MTATAAPIPIRDGFVDVVRHVVERDGERTSLSAMEAQLFAYLARHPEEDVSRWDILADVWGHRSDRPSRAADVTMHRLRHKVERDPGEPYHLVTVHGVGYRFVPVADRPPHAAPAPRAPASNVPAERDAFFGREHDLEALREAVSEHRLVTILGLGGSGKTRLAQRFATEHEAVCWVDLAAARSAADVAGAVATALEVGADDLLAGVGRALAARPRLLVLDDLERAAGPAAEVLAAWLEAAPEARFLVTSRVRLGVQGEAVLDLGPLAEDAAAELLVERARMRRPDLAIGPDEARDLAVLLEGLPLAIELAAARLRAMSLEQVRAGLDRRLALLADRRSDRPRRHHTLRAAMDGSWALLEPPAAELLSRLAVFRGGFDLAAAEAVAPGEGPALDLLEDLVDRGLVVLDAGRFRLLETVRAYAEEQLQDPAAAERAHVAHFAAVAPGLERGVDAPDVRGLERLQAEEANLRAALVRSNDPASTFAIAIALERLSHVTGRFDLHQELVEHVELGTDPDLRARVCALHVEWEAEQADFEAAREWLARGRAELGPDSDPRARAELSYAEALLAIRTGGDALAAIRSARRAYDQAGHAAAVVATRQVEGSVLAFEDPERALAWEQETLRQAEAIGFGAAIGASWSKIGKEHARAGRPQLAEAALDKALALGRELRHMQVEAAALVHMLAPLLDRSGRPDEAETRLIDFATRAQARGDVAWQLRARLHAALLRLERGDADGAEALLDAGGEPPAWLANSLQHARARIAWLRGDLGQARLLLRGLPGLGAADRALLGDLPDVVPEAARPAVRALLLGWQAVAQGSDPAVAGQAHAGAAEALLPVWRALLGDPVEIPPFDRSALGLAVPGLDRTPVHPSDLAWHRARGLERLAAGVGSTGPG